MADDDRGDRRLEPNTPEWFAENRRRYGHPSGPHARPAESDDPMRASSFHPRAEVSELVEMLHGMTVGSGPSASPAKSPEIGKSFGLIISALALALTVGTSAVAVVQSNTRLYDKVENIDGRLQVVEKRQVDNLPRIDQQASENKMQNDRINSIVESLAEERKQRGADSIENRKAMQDIMALIGRYADKLADIDKSVAVMQSGGRRSEVTPPVRDAQVMQGR